MNQKCDNNIFESVNNDNSERTSLRSDTDDIKKNRKIISEYFRFINTKKALDHEIIKIETINFFNSLKKDITQIYDQDKNNRIFEKFPKLNFPFFN